MALGDRIRYFRKWRGLTQQELGEAVGFSRGSADVRIGQYESNAKKPREETLLALADALGVNVDALLAPDISSKDRIMQTLFQLEDELGFYIDKEGAYYSIHLNSYHEKHAEMKELFAEWYDAYMRYRKSRFDPIEYDKWRYRYPYYNPQFEDEEAYREFMQRRQEIASWNLWCICLKQPPEGDFKVESMYLAKMITASQPQEYRGQTVDEGFFVLDADHETHHYSMTDFPKYFKVE